MKRQRNYKSTRLQPGLSIVELVIVLGISALLVIGANQWFSSRKSPDFFNSMRQIESVIRETQSESASNIMPGYIAACGTTAGRNPSTGTCPIRDGEFVFGTAIGVQKQDISNGSNTQDNLRIYYLKKMAPECGSAPSAFSCRVTAYAAQNYALPLSIKFRGYKIVPSVAGVCSGDYGNIDRNAPPDTVPTNPYVSASRGQWNMMIFRRQPNTMYSFYNTGAMTYDIYSPTDIDKLIPFPSNSSVTSYSVFASNLTRTAPDAITPTNNPVSLYNYGYDNPIDNMITRPCAVLWQFESADRTTVGGVTTPRFTAEINYNVRANTVTVQSR